MVWDMAYAVWEPTTSNPILLLLVSLFFAVSVACVFQRNGFRRNATKLPKSSESMEPSKPSKPLCIRISALPGEVTENELRSWLNELEPSRKTVEENSSDPTSAIVKSASNLIQLHLAGNGGKKQATATFVSVPVIFEKIKEYVSIEHSRWNHAVADTHFEGITVAYAPPAGTIIQADIVALSGLGGHALGSWGAPRDYKVWLRDFLPEDMKDIRVLLWGYNTTIMPGADRNWKEQYSTLAISMLQGLKGARGEEAKHRPIIFLGHSLGGLVVEEALVIAHDNQDDDNLSNISQCTAGALLFGVPHEGIRFWELVKAVEGRRSETFIKNLQTDADTEPSEVLKMHIRNFGRILKEQGFPVVCYWEKEYSIIPPVFQQANQSEITRLLVTENSAKGVGIILKPFETLGLQGDHRSIVKFKTMNDEGYKSARDNIKSMIRKFKVRCQNSGKVETHQQRDLDTLAFPEMNYREQEIRDAHTDTCSWILEHESYRKWVKNDSGILGIRGKPGSGKSTLLKKIFQTFNLDEDQMHVQLAFFYHRRGAAIQYSQIGMYRTLLHQLLSQIPSAGAHFWKLVEEKRKWQGDIGKNWKWRLEELQLAFSDALWTVSKSHKIRIFTDALDEGDEKAANEVISYFREI